MTVKLQTRSYNPATGQTIKIKMKFVFKSMCAVIILTFLIWCVWPQWKIFHVLVLLYTCYILHLYNFNIKLYPTIRENWICFLQKHPPVRAWTELNFTTNNIRVARLKGLQSFQPAPPQAFIWFSYQGCWCCLYSPVSCAAGWERGNCAISVPAKHLTQHRLGAAKTDEIQISEERANNSVFICTRLYICLIFWVVISSFV